MSDEDAKSGRKNGIDPARRATLKRLGLGVTTLYCAPLLTSLSQARASSVSFSGYRRPRRARARARPAPPPPPPEIVVSAPQTEDIAEIAASGYTLLSEDGLELTGARIARFQLPAGRSVDAARAEIEALVPEALFDLNTLYRPGEFLCGDDSCAAFEAIGWNTAAHSCPAGTRIGLIDTQVNTGHAALEGVQVETLAVMSQDRQPSSATHGTAVAILLGGRQDSRTPGLLDGVELLAADAFHRDARGEDAADAFDVARALDRLVAREVGVVNMSFAGPDNVVLRRVVEAAHARGVVLVAAAGNSGPNAEPLYPAGFEEVVAVTAVDRGNAVWRNAAAGPHIDFAAPGVALWTAASVSGGRLRSGTSYAAPFVAAALAVARVRDPQAEPAALVERLASEAVDLGAPGRDAAYGWGMVQSPGTCEPASEEAVFRPAGG